MIRPIRATEVVPLRDALDRVLANDLVARVAVPAHDNAAMDGYALDSRSVDRDSTVRVVGEARAGHPFAGRVGRGTCVRILTGAVMPPDCDAVVPQELVDVAGDAMTLRTPITSGQHRRLAGEDFAIGAVALSRGRRLTPADIGIAASLGAGTLPVHQRPRVAVFSTGNELRDVDDVLVAGTVRDANRHVLTAMLRRLGIDVVDLGIVADDPSALDATLRSVSDDGRIDAVVTSGGVSAGDADHTRAVLQRAGRIEFWTLAIKPGRPMAFGTIASPDGEIPFFALPGNPVAVMVVFYALVRSAMLGLTGAIARAPLAVTAICDDALPKAPGRTEFVRGLLSRRDDGWHVASTGDQGSGILRSMSRADCLVVLEHDRGPIAAGDIVTTWPFDALV